MDIKQERDVYSSFEPVVIIDSSDEEPDEDNYVKIFQEDPLKIKAHDLLNSIGPEISIIPVNNKKSRITDDVIFDREYSPSKDGLKVRSYNRSPRTQVRRVSKDEALNAEETYNRRRSSPLEKCPICKKYFRRLKTHLLKHDMVNINGKTSYSCTICMKVFNSHSNLQIHIRSHTGDKPYICDVCQKSFSQSCNLVNHMRIHTGEKPFKCPHCDRAFTQSGNLNNHIRLHTDDKPFKCHYCDKAFVQSGNLSSHIRNNHKFADFQDYVTRYQYHVNKSS